MENCGPCQLSATSNGAVLKQTHHCHEMHQVSSRAYTDIVVLLSCICCCCEFPFQ